MAPVLEVADLHKRFGDTEVLKGIDFSTPAGQVIALIGSSGSGKSTLLRCINMLEVPDKGFVRIDGEEIAMETLRGVRRPADQAQLHRIRAELGMVFQSFNLWSHMTILRNVMEAPLHVQKRPRADVEEQARALLRKVGIAEKADAYPAELSGGQQQRAAIARALCINPKVMLFDEPTSALDPEIEGEVLRVIEVLADEGRTMLLVTHNLKFARDVADRVIFLHQGLIEEDGTVEEVFGSTKSPRLQQFLAAGGH
ncbi:MAG: ATP-binding cassette domain-containing protein [Bauldia sp.]|nr:ATP-binding cassette domain-containing protein [Bauldia sp.]